MRLDAGPRRDEKDRQRFRRGDHLRLRGRPWRVRHATPWSDCLTLSLLGSRPADRLTVVLPADRPVMLTAAPIAVLRPRRWRHLIRQLAAETRRFGQLEGAVPRRLRLLPYQLEPVLTIVTAGTPRLLITDAVGLGKTIQAGLILAELAHRRDGFRSLVVVPAGLRQQWREELLTRFDLDAPLADAAWLRHSAADLPSHVNPWSRPGLLITSMDFIKQPEVLAALDHLLWDLVVVDEAHLASVSSERRAAIDAVCRRAAHVVLLTATPHPGDPAAFRALCDIGRLPHDPPVVRFDRRQPRGTRRPPRRSRFHRIHLTAAEHRVHALLAEYLAAVEARAAAVSGLDHAGLLITGLRKRALSSPAALARTLARRIAGLDAWPTAAAPPLQPSLPLGDEDDAPVLPPVLARPALERRWLAAIAAAARSATAVDSKRAWLLRLLHRTRESVLVFTEYRDTLEHLVSALSRTGRRVLTLHGGLDTADRARVLAEFDRGNAVLLATDVAAEGLNLQRCCRLIVHYELPWSLTRLVQRAGRVDRLGQTRCVHEIALVAQATTERLVLQPLARRAIAAARAGSPIPLLSERAVAALVAGAQPPEDLQAGAACEVGSSPVTENACLEADRLAAGSAAGSRGIEDRRSRRLIATRVEHGTTCRVYLVVVFTCRDAALQELHAQPLVLEIDMAGECTVDAAAGPVRRVCRVVDALCANPGGRLAGDLRTCARRVLDGIAAGLERRRTAERSRLEDMAAAIGSEHPEPVQHGLFDVRVARAAAAQADAVAAVTADIAARIEGLRAGGLEIAATPRAVLVVAPGRR